MRNVLLALILCPALALPSMAQEGPLVIDIPNANDADHPPLFPRDLSAQMSASPAEGDALVIDVEKTSAPVPATTVGAVLPPLTQARRAGATRIEMLDRCAAFESSLATVMAADELRPQLARTHRDRFSDFTRAVVAERISAGLSLAEAEARSGESILATARLYMTEWQNAWQRTGSYLSSPLRRLDHLACVDVQEGREPVERPSLSDQLSDTAPEAVQ